MYYICLLKVEENLVNHADAEAEVSLLYLKQPYSHFYYTNHKKEYKKELLVKREENLARREKHAESN